MFYIQETDWYEIISWAKLSYDEDKNEISGLATAIPNKDGIYCIQDVEILKQENSGSNTELDGDAVADYKMRYGMKYQNPNMKFVWWHSHHTMAAFWSGTDKEEIDAWKNSSFSLALVVNLKEEYKFRVSIWKAGNLDLEQHFDIPLHIIRSTGVLVTDNMKKKYEKLCEDKCSYTVGKTYKGGHLVNRQGHLWGKTNNIKTIQYNDINAYEHLLQQIESNNDEFMSGTMTFKEWKENMAELQKLLDEGKITDYKILIPKANKQDVINEIMTTMPDGFLEFKDNQVEWNYQNSLTGDTWGTNGYY